jgi:hypothetical protein
MFHRAAVFSLLCLLPVAAAARDLGPITGFSANAGPNDPYIDSADPASGSGPLRISYGPGHVVVIPNDPQLVLHAWPQGQQTDFDDLQLAPDHRTLGWLADYMACAQSYPCALDLVIFRNGKILRAFTPEYGIFWGWQFRAGGAQVAVQYGFPHGDNTGAYKLYDVASGKMLQEYNGTGTAPDWVRNFRDPLDP